MIDDHLPNRCFAFRINIESQRYHAGNWIAADFRERRVGAGLDGSFWTPMTANLGVLVRSLHPLGLGLLTGFEA